MSTRIDLLLHGCQLEHVPEYVTSAERVERLARLRSSAMGSWEEALEWGGGNYLTKVYAPMVVGLIDIAKLAEQLLEHPGDERLRAAMRRELDDYRRDLDSAKYAEQYEQRRTTEQAERKAADALARADAEALRRGKT